jgi:GTP:adenosylcobinamide-phosphate guanylyltransferase
VTFIALVLAGERPRGGRASLDGWSRQALMPVAGVPMLLRVVRALRAARSVGRVVVCGVDAPELAAHDELRSLLAADAIELCAARATPSTSVAYALEQLGPGAPVLVTTADHPLLTPAIVDEFCQAAAASSRDVAVGLVPAAVVRAAHPTTRRTYLRFRDGAYKGANLFALLTPEGRRAPAAWVQVEQHRKRPWRMIRRLGPVTLLRFLARRLALDDVVQLAARKIGVEIGVVVLPYADGAIDVDKPDDLALAETILRARGRDAD